MISADGLIGGKGLMLRVSMNRILQRLNRGKMDDFGGIDPPAHEIEMENLPCSCGEKHENDKITWHASTIKLGHSTITGQEFITRCKRCNVCKEVLMIGRKK